MSVPLPETVAALTHKLFEGRRAESNFFEKHVPKMLNFGPLQKISSDLPVRRLYPSGISFIIYKLKFITCMPCLSLRRRQSVQGGMSAADPDSAVRFYLRRGDEVST